MSFSRGKGAFIIDFTIVLTAAKTVQFEDTKEGMFAIRVALWLREDRGSAQYLSSEGESTASEVWGKRARWMKLEGKTGESYAGLALLNHPESVNYPTFWHTRAYGLFSANPLGQSVFQSRRGLESQPLNMVLEKEESCTFRFRVIIYDGRRSATDIESQFNDYINE